MKIKLLAITASAALLLLAGCSASNTGAGVPSLSSGSHSAGGADGQGPSRMSAVHAAASCIRSHGAPTYQDPVLDASGHLYTDARTIQDLSTSQYSAIDAACGSLIAAAGFQPADEPPAPPALVRAGVKLAQCVRANGLPNYRDPTSSTPFTPGHGFGITADEMPNNGAGGKGDPSFQHAFGVACKSLNDAEIQASALTQLAHG